MGDPKKTPTSDANDKHNNDGAGFENDIASLYGGGGDDIDDDEELAPDIEEAD